MSRGPIIDTGLSQALGFGSQQGIDIFRVMEDARRADLQRDILRDQMNRLEAWRQTQAMVDRERIAQDNQELKFRQDEASRKRAADAADGAWYRRQLPQPGVGRMPVMGAPGAALPMQLPDPFAGAPTDAVKELWTLDARRQSEEMGRATVQNERAMKAQRKIRAVRGAGGDDQDVFDNLKADNLEEFMQWEDSDFAAAKGRIADLFEASMTPLAQRGELNPSDYQPAVAALRRGDIDLDTAKSLVAMAKADKSAVGQMTPEQFEQGVADFMTLNPKATRQQAEARVRAITGYGIGERFSTLDADTSQRDEQSERTQLAAQYEAQAVRLETAVSAALKADPEATAIRLGPDSLIPIATVQRAIAEAKARAIEAKAGVGTAAGGAGAAAPAQAAGPSNLPPVNPGETREQYRARVKAMMGGG